MWRSWLFCHKLWSAAASLPLLLGQPHCDGGEQSQIVRVDCPLVITVHHHTLQPRMHQFLTLSSQAGKLLIEQEGAGMGTLVGQLDDLKEKAESLRHCPRLDVVRGSG